MSICPDCGCTIEVSWHSAVHEMWEVSKFDREHYLVQEKLRQYKKIKCARCDEILGYTRQDYILFAFCEQCALIASS